MADREGLILIIAIAHNHGMDAICMDPELDGTGGEQVSLNELMSLAKSME